MGGTPSEPGWHTLPFRRKRRVVFQSMKSFFFSVLYSLLLTLALLQYFPQCVTAKMHRKSDAYFPGDSTSGGTMSTTRVSVNRLNPSEPIVEKVDPTKGDTFTTLVPQTQRRYSNDPRPPRAVAHGEASTRPWSTAPAASESHNNENSLRELEANRLLAKGSRILFSRMV